MNRRIAVSVFAYGCFPRLCYFINFYYNCVIERPTSSLGRRGLFVCTAQQVFLRAGRSHCSIIDNGVSVAEKNGFPYFLLPPP